MKSDCTQPLHELVCAGENTNKQEQTQKETTRCQTWEQHMLGQKMGW